MNGENNKTTETNKIRNYNDVNWWTVRKKWKKFLSIMQDNRFDILCYASSAKQQSKNI